MIEPTYCQQCEKTVKETFVCERCDDEVCSDCLAVYNQFTQIDYDCCKVCAKHQPED